MRGETKHIAATVGHSKSRRDLSDVLKPYAPSHSLHSHSTRLQSFPRSRKTVILWNNVPASHSIMQMRLKLIFTFNFSLFLHMLALPLVCCVVCPLSRRFLTYFHMTSIIIYVSVILIVHNTPTYITSQECLFVCFLVVLLEVSSIFSH